MSTFAELFGGEFFTIRNEGNTISTMVDIFDKEIAQNRLKKKAETPVEMAMANIIIKMMMNGKGNVNLDGFVKDIENGDNDSAAVFLIGACFPEVISFHDITFFGSLREIVRGDCNLLAAFESKLAKSGILLPPLFDDFDEL